MSKSLYDVNVERQKKFDTLNNKHSDFPVGSRVMVICLCQDFNFFDGNELGIVTKNTGGYLGITVQFDETRKFRDGSIQKSFNFAPDDLILFDDPPEVHTCPYCGQEVAGQ